MARFAAVGDRLLLHLSYYRRICVIYIAMIGRLILSRWLALAFACAIVCTVLAWPRGKVIVRFDGWKAGRLGRIACLTVLNESNRRVTVADTYVGQSPYWASRDLAFKWKMNELFETEQLTINTVSTAFWDNVPLAPIPSIGPHCAQSMEVELWDGVTSVDLAVVPGMVWPQWAAEGKYARFPGFLRQWFIKRAVRESEVRDAKHRIRVDLPPIVTVKEPPFWDTPGASQQ
jgi:hypothetical protein